MAMKTKVGLVLGLGLLGVIFLAEMVFLMEVSTNGRGEEVILISNVLDRLNASLSILLNACFLSCLSLISHQMEIRREHDA